jgi:hypothetical protein
MGLSAKSQGLAVNRVANVLTKNWVLNTLTRLQTASPLTVLGGGSVYVVGDPILNSFEGFADRVPGVPVYLHGSTIPGGIQLNPAAFQKVPVDAHGNATRNGDSGRNAYRLFGLHEFDLGVGRKFVITERMGLEFKAEAFNILNTPNFADVQNTFGQAHFGQAQATAASFNGGLYGGNGGLNPVFQSGGARNLQLTARISF